MAGRKAASSGSGEIDGAAGARNDDLEEKETLIISPREVFKNAAVGV